MGPGRGGGKDMVMKGTVLLGRFDMQTDSAAARMVEGSMWFGEVPNGQCSLVSYEEKNTRCMQLYITACNCNMRMQHRVMVRVLVRVIHTKCFTKAWQVLAIVLAIPHMAWAAIPSLENSRQIPGPMRLSNLELGWRQVHAAAGVVCWRLWQVFGPAVLSFA